MVIYHKPAEAPLGFNPLYLETGSEAEKELVVDQFCQLLRGVTPGSWGHVQDAALSQALWRTLSEPYPNVRKLIENLPDNEGLKARVAMLLSAPTLDKMLNADPIPLRSLIVHGGVYLLNMGGMGKRSAAVCYRLHLLRLEQIALSLRLGEGKGCMLICDEIQRARQHAEGLADMLAELRKYGFAMLLAHHDTDQMSKELTHYYSLLGNHYLFRLNNKDAAAFADVTFPITPITVTHLSNYTCVRRRQVHGIAEQPRVVKTSLPPKRRLSDAEVQAIKTRSVEQYGATNRTRRTTVDSFRTQESSDYEPATEVLPGQKRRHIVRVHEEENATAGGRWVSEKLPSTDGKRGNEAMGDGVLPY
jgi:hypothetical protein